VAASSGFLAMNVPVDLSTSVGALFIGFSIALVLWGVQILQSFWYYLNYPKDSAPLKVWVLLMNLLASADVAFSFAGIWNAAIRNSGTPPNPFSDKHILYRVAMYAFVGFFAQMFFLYRIFKFASMGWVKYLVPLALLPLIVYQTIANMIFAVTWIDAKPAANSLAAGSVEVHLLTKTRVWVISAYAAACATDILITIVMSALLLSQRSGIQRTDRLLVRIAVTSINTGSWTAINALLTVILTTTTPASDLTFSIPSWFASTLYVNTVLCNLNVRQFFRSKDDESNFIFSSTLRFRKPFRFTATHPTARSRNTVTRPNEHELSTFRMEAKHGDDDELFNTGAKATKDHTSGATTSNESVAV